MEFKNHDAQMGKQLKKTELLLDLKVHGGKTSPEVPPKVAPKMAPKVTPKMVLKTSESIILSLLAHNRNMTIDELVHQTAKSVRTIKRIIRKLQESGQLKRVGSHRSGHWEVLKKR